MTFEKRLETNRAKLKAMGETVVDWRAAQIEEVQAAVCAAFDVTLPMLRNPSREEKFSYPRLASMALCRLHCRELSLREIAQAHNMKDHGSVLYAEKRVTDLFDVYPSFNRSMSRAKRLLEI